VSEKKNKKKINLPENKKIKYLLVHTYRERSRGGRKRE
jgi:hypothetical protein